MPFQTITDEETGEERKVYVLPDKETPQKIETEKESSDMTGGFVGFENTGIAKGFQGALEDEGPGGWITRTVSHGIRHTLQEGNDRIIDELRGKHDPTEYEHILGYKKLGLDKPPWWAHEETTSADKPDHNFLFFDKPIPEVPTTGRGEHMAGELLSFIGLTIGLRKGGGKIAKNVQSQIGPRTALNTKVGKIINSPRVLAERMQAKNMRGWRAVKGAYEGAIPSAIAGNILQEPHEGNLANTLDEMGVPGANLLAVNPTDEASVARLKNDIVNFLFDPFPGMGFEYAGGAIGSGKNLLKAGLKRIGNDWDTIYKERLAELLTRTRQLDLLKKAKALKEKLKAADPATSSKEIVEPESLPTKSITGKNGVDTSPHPLREQTEDPLWASGYEEQKNIDYDQKIQEVEKQQEEAYQDLSRSQVIKNETITSDQSQDLSNKGVVPAVQKATPDQVTELSTKEISVNSDVFQVKAAGKLKKSGVSGSLKDIENYQEFLSGIISVWRDVNGEIGPANKVYVVNGHNRLDAAKRFGREKMVVRYLDAATAKEASNQGALQNMAESKLAAVDAARFIRNTGSTPQDLASQGIVLTDNTVNKAIAFSRLPDNLFTKLMEGTLSEAKAKALGSLDISPDIINDVAVTAGKGKWSAEKIEQAIQMAANASVKEEAGVIPGLGNFFKSTNAKQILDVRTEIVKLLNQEIIALRPASSEATANILEGAGNKITVEGSQSRRELATQSLAAFNKLAGQSGPLTDLITDLVGLVKGKNTAKKVVADNYSQIKETLELARTGQPTLKLAPGVQGFREFMSNPPEEYAPIIAKGKNLAEVFSKTKGLEDTDPDSIQTLIRDIDEQMDLLDTKIFSLEERGEDGLVNMTRFYLEDVYKSFDRYRVAAKNKLKAKTKPITTDPQEIQKKPLDTQKGVDADYMADGPALFGIGDEYINRRPNLTPEQIDELRRIVKLFGGGEVRIEIVESLDDIVSASKAAKDPSYAGKIGQKVSLSGSFRRMDLSDPTQDIVTLAMTSGGKPRSFSQMKLTAIHEATHRMYRRFLKESEYLLFKKGEKEIREIASKVAPWLDSTKIPLTEAVSYASMVWDNVRADYVTDKKVPTWATPLEKLKDLIFEVKKYLGVQRYKTWDELFDAQTEIVRGEYASPYRGVDDVGNKEVFGVPRRRGVQKPMTDYEIDPEDIVDGARRQREFIENGGSVEEAMKSNYRRFISRTGKTDYISRESVDLISMNKNLEESLKALLGERADVTNMPDYTVAELMDIASREFINNGANPETTYNNVLRARKGDIESQDELYATAGLLFHREWNLEQLNIANTDYLRAGTPEVEAKAAERLLARWEDQFKLDTAWTKVTRNASQILKTAQISHEDAIYPVMSRGVQIKFSTSDKAATSIVENGLTPQKGTVGDAAYFSTETTPGETEVFGGIPEDVRILDLVERNKDMLRFIQDIGLGKTKKTKDGFQLSPQQQQGVQDYLAERGYSGIRYGTDFIDNPAAGDQIAIFDIDSANKAIGSNAAPAPERLSETSTRKIIKDSLQEKEVSSSFTSKIPKRVIDKIKAGKIDQEARELLDMLSVISYEYASNPKSRKPASDLLEGIPKGQLKKNVAQSLYRNMIFFSMRTWMKVFAGSGYRALTLPINQILGEAAEQVRMNPEQTRLSQRRNMLNVKLYQQYGKNLPYAIRMAVTAMRQNEVLVNLGRGYTEEAGRIKQVGVVDQLELEGMKSRLREQTDGTEWHLDGNKNPIALAMKYTGAATTVPGRIMGGLDTFWAAMVGPSTEWARLMDQELFNADQKGFEIGSEAAWDWAESRVDTMLKAHFQDIDLANGEVIRNGRLKGPHAKKAMDWVNFTDDIEVKPETRTFQYGVRKAQEEGLVDASDIVKRANRWVQESPEPGQMMKNMHKITNLPGKAGEAVSNIPFVGYILHPINRTPTNLVKSAMRMTPGANMLVDSYWRDMNSEDHFTRSRAIGEVATGWMTLSMGVMMQKSGYVEFTGPGMTLDPLEEKERRERGWQPWSVRFKIPFTNNWSPYYDITMFDQLANVFASIAVFTENAARLDEDQRENVYGMATILIAKQVRDMGIGQYTKVGLGGMSDLMDVISELSDGDVRTKQGARQLGERYITNRLAGFYPQFMNTARIAADPYARRIDESDGVFGPVLNFLKTLALRTPGLSSTQPMVLHPTKGEPIFMNAVPGVSAFPKETPWLKMLYAWVSPLGATKARYRTTDIVDEEFLRLRGRGNTYNIWDRRMFNLKNRVLTSGEVEELIKIGTKEVRIAKYGNVTMHEALRRLILSPAYKKFESYDQEINQQTAPILINALINEYKTQAKEIFLSRNSEGIDSIGYLYEKQQKENQAVRDLSSGVTPTIREFEGSINY